MPSNPLTQEEINSYAISRALNPEGYTGLSPYMPAGYFLSTPSGVSGPALWRLFDASFISSGIIASGRLGTGATGAGNLYLADDGTWKTISVGGGGDMLKATYDTDNSGIVDNAEGISVIGRNSTGVTLYKGTVVYISGSTGNRPNFVKAQANVEATSAGTFGVVRADISNNSDGYVTTIGFLDNLDTRSSATHPFTDVTLADGDTVYLHPTIAGYITNVKPSAPNHLVYVGKVTRTSPTNGTIVYRIQNGYELDEIHDVAISSKANNDLLVYESASSLWKNKTFSAIFGGTPLVSVPTLNQVTTAGNTTTNAITVGNINANGQIVTRGATLPSFAGDGSIVVGGTNIGPSIGALLGVQIPYVSGAFGGHFIGYSNQTNPKWLIGISRNVAQENSLVYYEDSAAANPRLAIHPGGNVTIGTITDIGYKLDVNGTARVTGLVRGQLGYILNNDSSGTNFNKSFSVYSDGANNYGLTLSMVYNTSTGSSMGYGTTLFAPTLRNIGLAIANVGNPTLQSHLDYALLVRPDRSVLIGKTAQVGGYALEVGGAALVEGTLQVNGDITSTGVIYTNYIGDSGSEVIDLYANYVYTNFITALTGDLTVYTGSTERITIKETGNVLIGTTTDAGYKLDVNGLAVVRDRLTINGTTTTDYPLTLTTAKTGQYGMAYFSNTSAGGDTLLVLHNNVGGGYSYSSYGFLGYGGSGYTYPLFGVNRANRLIIGADGASNLGLYMGTLQAQPLVMGTNNVERMRIDASGNIGIGTTTPSELLDVAGNVKVGSYMKLGSSANYMGQIGFNRNISTGVIYNSSYSGYQFQNAFGSLQIQLYSNGGSYVTAHNFFSTGNVGIDTSTDSGYKLNVNGNIRAVLANTTTSNVVYYDSSTGLMTYGAAPSGGGTPTLATVTTAGDTTTNSISVGGLTVANSATPIATFNSSNGGGTYIGIQYNGVLKAAWGMGGNIVMSASSIDDVGFWSTAGMLWETNGTTKMKLTSGGNLIINNLSDNGNKFQVTGTIDGSSFAIGGVNGFTGTFTVPTNPSGQRNLNITGGIIMSVN